MRIFRHFEGIPTEFRGAAVAVGNFDGVHRGHLGVILEAGYIARAAGVPWAVLTFEPHPRSLFRPDMEPFRLTTFRAKARHLEEIGVDAMINLTFDRKFSEKPAEDFVRTVLVQGLGASHVISGYDFVFGHDRKGNCELLLHMGKDGDFGFTAQQAVHDESGVTYSSTRVRECLRAADPKGAAEILGRHFEIEGRVEHGDQRGRIIGFPTANLLLGDYIRPSFGVYAVRVGVESGEETDWYNGVANLGSRPTFEKTNEILEAHLFDFEGDIYGRSLRVQFVEFLRGEKKFDGIEDLTDQIAHDVKTARRLLESR